MDPSEKKRKVGPSLADLARPAVVLTPEEKQASEAREWEELRRDNKNSSTGSQVQALFVLAVPSFAFFVTNYVRQREEWMTSLPEGSRQDALQFFRRGKSSFSAKGAAGSEVDNEHCFRSVCCDLLLSDWRGLGS
jgi:hypothetical protein